MPSLWSRSSAAFIALSAVLAASAQPAELESRALALLGPRPDSALYWIEQVCAAEAAGPRCIYLRAAWHSRTGKLAEAWRSIREADALPTDDPALRAQVKNFLGRIAFDNDEFETAIAAFHAVLELTPPTDTVRIAVAHNNLGRVHERTKEYDRAFEAFEKSVALYEALGDTPRLAGSLLNLGVVYLNRGLHAEAGDRFLRSLDHARAAGMEDVECIALESMGNVQRETGHFTEAMGSYEAAMAITGRTGSMEGMASISRNIGQLHLAMGKPARALPFLHRTLALADSMGSRNYRQDAHFYLADAYKAMKRPSDALGHLEAYIAVKDSILSEEKNRAIAALQVRFETAEKERTILEQEVRIERDRLVLERQQRNMRYALAGLAGIALVLGLVVRDRLRARKLARVRIAALEQERRITALRGIVEGEERERQRVAGELHDGIGLLLSAARMRVDTGTPGGREKAGAILAEASSEVRRISHALMPGTLAKLGLPDALHELAGGLNESGALRVEMHMHGFHGRLSPEVETGLYRIVQEAVNNTVKHARATAAIVELSIEDGRRISLVITDDGRGFDPTDAGGSGHGVDNIRSRAALLGGEAIVRSAPGEGTVWEIDVPVPSDLHTR